MTFAFDTHAYIRRLREAKVPDAQAEAMAEGLAAALSTNVATSTDIVRLEAKIDGHIARLEAKIDALSNATKGDLAALENRLLLKLGSFILVVAGFALAIARMWQP